MLFWLPEELTICAWSSLLKPVQWLFVVAATLTWNVLQRRPEVIFMLELHFTYLFLATLVASLATLEGDEQFDASLLGAAEEVVQERISDDELILIKNTKARTSASVILRGANDVMLDEMERSLHDALCVVKRVLESKKLVVGGGAVEAALNIYLENFANTLVILIISWNH